MTTCYPSGGVGTPSGSLGSVNVTGSTPDNRSVRERMPAGVVRRSPQSVITAASERAQRAYALADG